MYERFCCLLNFSLVAIHISKKTLSLHRFTVSAVVDIVSQFWPMYIGKLLSKRRYKSLLSQFWETSQTSHMEIMQRTGRP